MIIVDVSGPRFLMGTVEGGGGYVLISVVGASTPYFFFSRAPITPAPRALSAAADSAKRQLIGMLGRSVPVNWTLRVVSFTSLGKSCVIKSLLKMPSWKDFLGFVGDGIGGNISIHAILLLDGCHDNIQEWVSNQ